MQRYPILPFVLISMPLVEVPRLSLFDAIEALSFHLQTERFKQLQAESGSKSSLSGVGLVVLTWFRRIP